MNATKKADKIARILCEAIEEKDIDAGLAARIAAHAGLCWDTKLDGIADLRARLLEIQKYRCAYCQTPIFADTNGLRELDHILPKDKSAVLDQVKAVSSLWDNRRHTKGYPGFRFLVRNLAISCKQCNTFKGSFDPLLIRHIPINDYPTDGSVFLWVHPHFHTYSRHIRISRNWLYQKESHEGATVIRVCKLDKAEVQARRRLAHGLAVQAPGLKECLHAYSGNHSNLSPAECADALIARFKLQESEATALTSIWFEHADSLSAESFARALELTNVVQARLAQL